MDWMESVGSSEQFDRILCGCQLSCAVHGEQVAVQEYPSRPTFLGHHVFWRFSLSANQSSVVLPFWVLVDLFY